MGRHPKVLITGAGGQVGTALRPLLPDGVFATHADLDVTDAERVHAAAAGVEVIVHLAAATDVDGCETDPVWAWSVNDEGTGNVIAAARSVGARVIYASTDGVFSGEVGGEYGEDDEPDPINTYGRSKLAGEKHLGPDDLIVRSSWIFGHGKNFVATILQLGERGPVRVIDDQRGRPTGAAELATALAWMLEQDCTGLFHVAGDGPPCSWADLAAFAFQAAGIGAAVERIDTATYRAERAGVYAPRPSNATLSLGKARSHGVPLVDWQSSVTRYVEGMQ